MLHGLTRYALALGLIGMFSLNGCNSEGKLAGNNELSGGMWSMRVWSPDFTDRKSIQRKYTTEGENMSPPLTWPAGPKGTREYVLIVEGTRPRGKQPNVHWIVYGIPANARGLPEGAASNPELVQGRNSKGTIGYTGPTPSKDPQNYYFQLFALSAPLNLEPGADRRSVIEAMNGLELAQGRLESSYGGK